MDQDITVGHEEPVLEDVCWPSVEELEAEAVDELIVELSEAVKLVEVSVGEYEDEEEWEEYVVGSSDP